jgi:hypothetical protein
MPSSKRLGGEEGHYIENLEWTSEKYEGVLLIRKYYSYESVTHMKVLLI